MKRVIKHYAFSAVVPAAFLALAPRAYALPNCTAQTMGAVVGCNAQGHPGEMTCLEPGTFSACRPSPNPPQPIKGTVFGKYNILTVIYAPPGTNGGKSGSQVSYESDSTTGTTTTNSSSFKQDYSISASVSCTDCDFGVLSGGASFDYTHNSTHADALTISKATTSKIQVTGPSADGVNHDNDQIWLFLRPKYDVTILGKNIIDWTLDPDQSAGAVQYLYVAQLKDPSKIPPGLLQDLQAAGITAQDYQQILQADPLAQCAPPVLADRVTLGSRPVGLPTLPCATPLPAAPRYVPANMNLPYDPPLTATDPVPLQTETIDNSTVSKQTNTYENDYKVGITASGGFNFLDVFKTTLTTSDSWTWTDQNSTEAQTSTDQKMALTLGGPAFGYTGPVNMDIYFDTLYQTFVFVPTELSPNVLHGVIMSSAGKPAAGQMVTATAGSVKYRTFTDAHGQYHFSQVFSGPVDLQTGSIVQKLAAPDATKSFDFRVQ